MKDFRETRIGQAIELVSSGTKVSAKGAILINKKFKTRTSLLSMN